MIYGHKFLTESISSIELDEATINQLLNEAFLNGILEEGLEDFVDENEIVEEGANIDSAKIFYTKVKEYKSALKESKKALKAKDYELAQSKVREASNALTEAKREINKIPSTTGSAVLGGIAAALETAVNILVLYASFALGTKVVGGVASGISAVTGSRTVGLATAYAGGGTVGSAIGISGGKELSKLIYMIRNIIKDIKSGKKDKTDTFNAYKQRLIATIDVLRENTMWLSIIIKNRKKKDEEKNKKK